MFTDEKTLQIAAGKGGDGAALFRREIYVPKGGPSGGDGGHGGNIYIKGKSNLHALTHLAHIDKVVAEPGAGGGQKKSTGKDGEDQVIFVPLGTVIEECTEDVWRQVGEITEEDQSILIAKGGNGGWGNWHFRTSVQQAPTRFNPGLPGEKKQIRLVLKLIADIGLLGLPNAGKSTFLSVVSSARPKIANYPFTTLEPQLGVVDFSKGEDHRQLIIADLPGLIEGASAGKGLGSKFLKHLERTKVLLHLVDGSGEAEEIVKNYLAIRNELQQWDKDLASKPEIVALTKADTLLEEDQDKNIAALRAATNSEVLYISSVAHINIQELLGKLLSFCE